MPCDPSLEPSQALVITTPDGRYIGVRGPTWLTTNPCFQRSNERCSSGSSWKRGAHCAAGTPPRVASRPDVLSMLEARAGRMSPGLVN